MAAAGGAYVHAAGGEGVCLRSLEGDGRKSILKALEAPSPILRGARSLEGSVIINKVRKDHSSLTHTRNSM